MTIKTLTPAARAKITTSKRLSTVVDKIKDSVDFKAGTWIPFFDEAGPTVDLWESVDNETDLDDLFDALDAAGLPATAALRSNGKWGITVTL